MYLSVQAIVVKLARALAPKTAVGVRISVLPPAWERRELPIYVTDEDWLVFKMKELWFPGTL